MPPGRAKQAELRIEVIAEMGVSAAVSQVQVQPSISSKSSLYPSSHLHIHLNSDLESKLSNLLSDLFNNLETGPPAWKWYINVHGLVENSLLESHKGELKTSAPKSPFPLQFYYYSRVITIELQIQHKRFFFVTRVSKLQPQAKSGLPPTFVCPGNSEWFSVFTLKRIFFF